MKHVLVVDDERDILTCLTDALAAEGYRVSAAVSGYEALDMLAQDLPDLLLLDLRMPGMSGLEVLQVIRRDYRDLPVVVCSALAAYRTDFEILNANVAAFVEKPFDLEDLIAIVRDAIGAPNPSSVS